MCLVCDRHWENHSNVFETEQERKAAGRPVGNDFLPFNEIPQVQNIVFGKNKSRMLRNEKLNKPTGKDPHKRKNPKAVKKM